tara:strand:+ start:576 stop:749 length:174 start_codon:yes stop_codon:yes gene_type:complete
MIDDEIKIGDVVQEKEGNRRHGLVLEVSQKERWKAAYIYWPDGAKTSHKLSFIEKMY